MVIGWKLAAIALVASAAGGGVVGWKLKADPKPAPVVAHKTTSDEAASDKSKKASDTDIHIAQITPAVVTKGKWKKYHPPTSITSCALPAQPCVCPTIGHLAEEGEHSGETGPGKTDTGISHREREEKDIEEKRKGQNIPLNLYPEDEAPRWTLGLGAAVSPLADARKVAPSVNVGFRAYKKYTLRAALDVPPADVKELRTSVWLELPL